MTKYLHVTRRTVATFLGLDPEAVVCHHIDVGGMFGSRGEIYPEDFLVPLAARQCGRPGQVGRGPAGAPRLDQPLARALPPLRRRPGPLGRLLAYRDEATIDLGAYPRPIGGRLAILALEALPGPYRWEALEAVCTGVATNKTPVGTMRGPSTYEVTFVRERALDIAARRLGMDPIELRRANLISRLPYRVELGSELETLEYDTGDYRGMSDRALAAAGLDALRQDVAARQRAGERVGLGAGFFVDHSGMGKSEEVTVALGEDGAFRVATSGAEIGQGIASMVRKVAGERLNVLPELIEVVTNDSRAQPLGNGTHASRSTVFVGSATHDGAGKLRELARQRAADLLGMQVEPGGAARWLRWWPTSTSTGRSWRR